MKEKMLLHVCCAPCSSRVLELLTKEYDITVFFYNPNITDKVRKAVSAKKEVEKKKLADEKAKKEAERLEEEQRENLFGNDQNQGLPLARTIDRMWIQNKLQPDQQPIISNEEFEQNLKEIFERWIRTSDEDYFIVDFPVNDVSDEMKDLINFYTKMEFNSFLRKVKDKYANTHSDKHNDKDNNSSEEIEQIELNELPLKN